MRATTKTQLIQKVSAVQVCRKQYIIRSLLVQCWGERARVAQPEAKHRNVLKVLTFAHSVTPLHSHGNKGNCS